MLYAHSFIALVYVATTHSYSLHTLLYLFYTLALFYWCFTTGKHPLK